MIIKVLSLHQPWASLCVEHDRDTGVVWKTIETRSWSTPYRGRLYIHASAALPKYAREAAREDPFREAITYITRDNTAARDNVKLLPRGAILGGVDLVDCLRIASTNLFGQDLEDILTRSDSQFEEDFGNYGAGRYAWLFKNAVKLPKPVPAKGKLGIWEFDLP